MTLYLLLFLVGLVTLSLGADWLVTGASRIAAHHGVSPLVVGLTIVAFGTSAPELVVSTTAAVQGRAGLAVGNVMGSTVANVGLIVGLGAIVSPLVVQERLLQRETPLLVLLLFLVVIFSINGEIGRIDGLLLVGVFVVYLTFLHRWGATGDVLTDSLIEEAKQKAVAAGRQYVNWIRLAFGLALLLLGATWLVDAAVALARMLDIPEEVIGATLVAVGTSVPELATTVSAAVRGMGDIAMGNIVGSNIFNLGLVLGVAATTAPLRISPFTVIAEVVPALVFCLALVPLSMSGSEVSRFEGGVLLAGYAAFIYLIL
ncbi:MAG TPA: calcium/sodium antiporter [Gemmatimonadota bacterium]|nr:calcium/sodium antiporter [Gemmatimonadota bacterium]